MRDPKRIQRILGKLAFYWRKNPDLRLGQLIYNIHAQAGEGKADIFNIEDEELERRLIDFFADL